MKRARKLIWAGAQAVTRREGARAGGRQRRAGARGEGGRSPRLALPPREARGGMGGRAALRPQPATPADPPSARRLRSRGSGATPAPVPLPRAARRGRSVGAAPGTRRLPLGVARPPSSLRPSPPEASGAGTMKGKPARPGAPRRAPLGPSTLTGCGGHLSAGGLRTGGLPAGKMAGAALRLSYRLEESLRRTGWSPEVQREGRGEGEWRAFSSVIALA